MLFVVDTIYKQHYLLPGSIFSLFPTLSHTHSLRKTMSEVVQNVLLGDVSSLFRNLAMFSISSSVGLQFVSFYGCLVFYIADASSSGISTVELMNTTHLSFEGQLVY